MHYATAYAGEWYPSDPLQARELMAEVFASAAQRSGSVERSRATAFLVPHAAPSYSGSVAAAAYARLAQSAPRRVVVLGFLHSGPADGVAIHAAPAVSTPLGTIEADVNAVAELCDREPFHLLPDVSVTDHSVEIQYPFLLTACPQAKVVPLFVGRMDARQRTLAADLLRELDDGHTVFVASSDLTHYGRAFGFQPFPVDRHTKERLAALDREVLKASSGIDVGLFLRRMERTRTTFCGRYPWALLLELLGRRTEEIFQDVIDYQTSGEQTSDYSLSVSYAAAAYHPHGAFQISAAAGRSLVASARQSIARGVPAEASEAAGLNQRAGVFVTVYQNAELRGCIGRVHEPGPLSQSVPHLALGAAFEDSRFRPIDRLAPVDVEISVLTPLKLVADPANIVAGEHGALLESGGRAGILLPQVATEHHWDTAQFLAALARKTGVASQAIGREDSDLSVFRAQILR